MTSPHPPFDPELAPALAAMTQRATPTVTPDMIGQQRAALALNPLAAPPLEVLRQRVDVEEHTVPGPAGAPAVGVLVLRPRHRTGALPGLVHLHGGGMIAGDNRVGLSAVMDWMDTIPMVVVSVEYRLAPEHSHPAPVEDCYAGLVWTASRAAELGIDPARLVVGGSSAGGGLAAAVALMARDRHGPALAGQLLMCPMLDDRALTPSSRELVGEGAWDSISNATGWQALLGGRAGGTDVSPYAAPARAADLSGLPPAYIDVGSVETFRDEDIAYAQRIMQSAGHAELHVWAGGFHGFEAVTTATISRAAVAARLSWLQRIFSHPADEREPS